jgi:hypothetical protein
MLEGVEPDRMLVEQHDRSFLRRMSVLGASDCGPDSHFAPVLPLLYAPRTQHQG